MKKCRVKHVDEMLVIYVPRKIWQIDENLFVENIWMIKLSSKKMCLWPKILTGQETIDETEIEINDDLLNTTIENNLCNKTFKIKWCVGLIKTDKKKESFV